MEAEGDEESPRIQLRGELNTQERNWVTDSGLGT